MLAAFEGWNDAGDAASTAVEHLALHWDATELSAIDPDEYYDFQVSRPTARMVDGVSRAIDWPTTRLTRCRPPGSAQDLILVRGIEPNMRWRAFCAEIIDRARELGVGTVITLGALLADTPAHPARPGHRHLVRQGFGRPLPAAALALPGPHRDRRGPPGRLRPGRDPRDLVLGRRAALRLAAARTEGHDRPAAARRGGPRRRGAARRPPRAGREVGAHGLGDGRRGRRGPRVRQGPRGGRRRRDRPRGGLRRGDRGRLRALPAPARPRRRRPGGTAGGPPGPGKAPWER